nr:MYG1 family protein [Clostridiales bacterium]
MDEANCITHSGRFHVDDVISTIFLSKIIDSVILARVLTISNKDVKDKIVYDIGLGEFDHHQKNRNGQRDNGIFYSSIGLLWKKFGKEYLKKIGVKYIDKTFEYMDKELIQNIDAADNMQFEYVENKISPDFVKLCNPRVE